jgi:ABC-type glycerol-3-phosphate transport system substrate-binding protein
MNGSGETPGHISRRQFLRWATVGTTSLLLAACGQSAGNSAEADGDDPNAPGVTTSTTIRLQSFLDPRGSSAREKALATILDRFHRDHSNIQVTVEVVSIEQLKSVVQEQVKASNAPEVTFFQSQYITQAVLNNTLTPLDPLISGMGSEWRNQFSNQDLWSQSVINTKKYSLALGENVRVLFARPQLITEAGLDATVGPQTLTELTEFGRRLTNESTYGLAMPLAQSGSTIELTFNSLYWGYGGDEHLDVAGRAIFNNLAGVKALDFMYKMVHDWKITSPDAPSLSYSDLSRQFGEGRFAMILDGGHRLQDWQAQGLNEETLVAYPFPNSTGGPGPMFINSFDLAIPNGHSEARQEVAWKLISYFFTPENIREFSIANGSFSPLASLANEPEFNTPWHQTMRKVLDQYGRTLPKTANLNEINTVLLAALSKLLETGRGTQQLLDEAVRSYNEQVGLS